MNKISSKGKREKFSKGVSSVTAGSANNAKKTVDFRSINSKELRLTENKKHFNFTYIFNISVFTCYTP